METASLWWIWVLMGMASRGGSGLQVHRLWSHRSVSTGKESAGETVMGGRERAPPPECPRASERGREPGRPWDEGSGHGQKGLVRESGRAAGASLGGGSAWWGSFQKLLSVPFSRSNQKDRVLSGEGGCGGRRRERQVWVGSPGPCDGGRGRV